MEENRRASRFAGRLLGGIFKARQSRRGRPAPPASATILVGAPYCPNTFEYLWFSGAIAGVRPLDGLESVKKNNQVAVARRRKARRCRTQQPYRMNSLTMAQGIKRLGMPIAAFLAAALIGLIAISWMIDQNAVRAFGREPDSCGDRSRPQGQRRRPCLGFPRQFHHPAAGRTERREFARQRHCR